MYWQVINVNNESMDPVLFIYDDEILIDMTTFSTQLLRFPSRRVWMPSELKLKM